MVWRRYSFCCRLSFWLPQIERGLQRAGDEKALLIQKALDIQTDAWGIKVSNVEIKHLDIDESMIRAVARQTEAERERRAKVIHAEGELQASNKLMQAAQVLSQQTGAMQLRYLQTLTNIATDKSNTIIFPIPMDLVSALTDSLNRNPKKTSE